MHFYVNGIGSELSLFLSFSHFHEPVGEKQLNSLIRNSDDFRKSFELYRVTGPGFFPKRK